MDEEEHDREDYAREMYPVCDRDKQEQRARRVLERAASRDGGGWIGPSTAAYLLAALDELAQLRAQHSPEPGPRT